MKAEAHLETGPESGHLHIERLQRLILEWWAGARTSRDELPWRRSRDPWGVLVAEVMLAQTQTARVVQRYVEFMRRFPTADACARSNPGDVLRAWSGLGYNRRALAIHRAACEIVERHGGSVPQEYAQLVLLDGVGPYTAQAIMTFAFDSKAAPVDTNIRRVLARAVVGDRLTARNAQRVADALLPNHHIREWNLALMDFGSLVCSSSSPWCDRCPLGAGGACAWMAKSKTEIDDPARPRAPVQTRFRGSDREGRGRLVRAACEGPVAPDEVCLVTGWPDQPDRARRITEELVVEGILVEGGDGYLRLP